MTSMQYDVDGAIAPQQRRQPSLPQLSRSWTDISFHDFDWSMYDYHPADDGGFWKLQPEYYPASDQHPDEIPLAVTSRSPVQKSQDVEWTCLSPACPAKAFKRKADLDRHYKVAHTEKSSQKDSPPPVKEAKEGKEKDNIFYCDYSNCDRSREGFTRKDRFRLHIQETHKEDVNKKGGKFEDEWLQTRKVSTKWWRCSKCLDRVKIPEHGYECPGCSGKCEKKRQELREAKSET